MSNVCSTLTVEIEPHCGASIESQELSLVDPFEWSVTRVGEEITLSLGSGENEKSEIHSTTTMRKYLLKNYNWNGIVNLVESISEKDDEFDYTRPLNLTGIPSSDDLLIIPNDALDR